MMKKSTLLTMVIFLVAILIYSCDKDEFSEADAYQYTAKIKQMETDAALEKAKLEAQVKLDSLALKEKLDSLERLHGIYHYAVNVVSGGDAGFNKSGQKSIYLRAKVTINQNSVTRWKITDTDGIATFSDLRAGTATVNVQSCDENGIPDGNFTTVDLIVDLPKEWSMNDENWLKPEDYLIPLDKMYYGVVRNAATLVPIFPMIGTSMSTLKGVVTYENDLTNDKRDPVAGVAVIAAIDTKDTAFISKYLNMKTPKCDECTPGQILDIVYGDIVARDNGENYIGGSDGEQRTYITNAYGEYALRIPSTADGLPLRIEVNDVEGYQKLLINKLGDKYQHYVQQVRTIWSTNRDAYKTSLIPTVPPAYVEFSAPEGITAIKPTAEATAKIVHGNSGIEFVTLTQRGGIFTEAPGISITQKLNGITNATAKAHAVLAEGELVDIVLDDPGTNYSPNFPISVAIKEVSAQNPNWNTGAAFTGTVTASLSGDDVKASATTTAVNLNQKHGYDFAPVATILSDLGNGAEVKANVVRYIDHIDILDAGEGFTQTPDVFIMDNGVSIASNSSPIDNKVTVNMTGNGPIHDIKLTSAYLNSLASPTTTNRFVNPAITITGGSGYGARAVPVLANKGSIVQVIIDEPGSGYDINNLPVVKIIGDGDYAECAVTALDLNGGIKTVALTQQGNYFTQAIVVVETSTSATPAKLRAVIGYPLTDIALIENGSGYVTAAGQVNIGLTITDPYAGTVNMAGNFEADINMSIASITVPNIEYNFDGRTPEVVIVPKNVGAEDAKAIAIMKYKVKNIEVIAGGSGYNAFAYPIYITFPAAPNGNTPLITVKGHAGKGTATFTRTSLGWGTFKAKPYVIVQYTNNTDGKKYYYGKKVLYADIDAAGHVISIPSITLESNGSAKSTIDNIIITSLLTNNMIAGGTTYIQDSGDAFGGMNWDSPAASASAYDASGRIDDIHITNPGVGYDIKPAVEIYAEALVGSTWTELGLPGTTVSELNFEVGTGFEAHAVMENGRVNDVIIDNPGFGYYKSSTLRYGVRFIIPQATTQAVGLVQVANGQIIGVTFTNNGDYTNLTPGEGYVNPPTVRFSSAIPGMGSKAAATAKINAKGQIVNVIMTNKGEGYYAKNNNSKDIAGVVYNGTSVFAIDENTSNPGRAFSVNEISDVTTGTLNGRGFRLVSTMGKTYVLDFDLGTGYRMDY